MCFRSIQVRVNGSIENVPCGKCPQCCYNRLAGWTFRLLQEERVSTSAHFLTLTYDSASIVSTPNGRASICKYDLQCFFKRLRKASAKGSSFLRHKPIKYYAVGEYGGKTQRPHYHIILFNADIELVESAWQKGTVFFGDVSHASVGYTLKYLNKQCTAGLFGLDDRHPQFSVSSNGLGISYLTDAAIRYHLADLHNRRYLVLPGGQKTSMPRYYYERLYDGYQRDLLKMSGSLIRQDQFYKDFVSVPVEQRMKDIVLFDKRVEAAFRRHEFNNSKILML